RSSSPGRVHLGPPGDDALPMPSSTWGRLAMPPLVLAVLAVLGLGATAALALPHVGASGTASTVGLAALVGATLVAVGALGRRAVGAAGRDRRPWLLLALAALAQVV